MENEQTPVTQQHLREALDRDVEASATEFTMLRAEMKSNAENTGRRLDRVSETLQSIDTRMGALTKSADSFDRLSRLSLGSQPV